MSELIRKENRISIGPNKRREAKSIDFNQYCHIINKEETRGFFNSIKELYEMILKYASSDTIKRVKKLVPSSKSKQNSSNGLDESSTTMDSKEKQEGNDRQNNVNNSPDRDEECDGRVYTRESLVDTDRSLAEGDLLADKHDEDYFDASNTLSLSYTYDNETSRYDEDRENKRRMRKDKKKKEREFSFAKIDDPSDPTNYEILNRFLLRAHKLLDKLDSGGKSLRAIFEESENSQFESFRYFIMNLEIYGSFIPINDKLFDMQVTRISAYLKVSKIRKGLDLLVKEHEDSKGKILKNIILKAKMISYFFNKVEAFLARKQRQSSSRKTKEKNQFCIDYDLEVHKEEEKIFDTAKVDHENTLSEDESNDGEESKYATPKSGVSVIEDDEDEYYYVKTLFRDFTEPDVIKTGYLIPLTCGHNGCYKNKEKSLYEIHLRQSGFLS